MFDFIRRGNVYMNSHLKLKNKIRELRKERGLSQSELAKLAGTTQNTISSLETGQYSPTAFLSGMIIIALDCKWEDCFWIDEED